MTIDHQALADRLRDAEHDRIPTGPLSADEPAMTVADAYRVQLVNIERRLAAGRAVVGHKIGLTAKAMQEMLGVHEPDYGHLLDDMVVADGATVPAAAYLQPRVEVEIAFRLSRPLAGPGVTAADVLAATEAIAPSIEIIDSRIANWKIGLVDTIADNASSAGVVVGPWVPYSPSLDLPSIAADLVLDGEVAASGHGRDVLGDPAEAVAWLANALSAFGASIAAGEIVIPGSCTRAVDVKPGSRVTARFAGLGECSVAFS